MTHVPCDARAVPESIDCEVSVPATAPCWQIGVRGRSPDGHRRYSSAMRFLLGEEHLPQAWFNVLPHLDEPLLPPLHPGDARARRP